MDKYWAYENSKNNGHRTRVHKEGCRYCMFQGQNGPISLGPGRIWHGPFEKLDSAMEFAQSTGGIVTKCRLCMKDN